MAYRWRNGRLMSDEEVYHDDQANRQAVVHVGAAVILPLVLAGLGYRWGNRFTMLVGAGVGAWLTWAFYGPLVKLWRAALALGDLPGHDGDVLLHAPVPLEHALSPGRSPLSTP